MQQKLYFLAVIPHEQLKERVKELKLEMKDRFGAKHALKSPAHITLQMPFKAAPIQEDYIIDVLRDFAGSQSSFDVQLSGFGCFKPRVIFINITNPEPLIMLHKQLKPVLMNKLNFTEKQTGKRLSPHMTIATRDLTEEAFHEAWPEFRERKFEDSFRVSSIYLLRHNGKYWDIYKEAEFGG